MADRHDKAADLEEPGGKLRLYVPAELGAGLSMATDESQTHYLLHVMRAKPGDRVLLFNGRDGEWTADIAQAAKRAVTLTCHRQTAPQAGVPDLWLAFAPIKKTPADYLVQKATELGVAKLLPVFTRRTIVTRVNEGRMAANAVEAAEQSGRLTVPEIAAPQSLEKLLATWPKERRLYFCDEGGDAKPLAQALADAGPPPPRVRSTPAAGGGSRPSEPTPVAALAMRRAEGVLTGPEGGFDPSERAMLRELPFVIPVTLGPRILRADTAALAALAVWQAVAGDWRQE